MARSTDVLPAEAAKTTAGVALVRRPLTRSDGTVIRVGHVALADGEGGTIEAMDSRHGVARGRIEGRSFDLAVRLPGIDYADRPAAASVAAHSLGVSEAVAAAPPPAACAPAPAEEAPGAAVEIAAVTLEQVIGADGRKPVARAAMTHAPWRAICHLTSIGTGSVSLQGTGWLVSPRTVVTAGHVLFDKKDLGGRANSVTVAVARCGEDHLALRTSQRFVVHPRYESAEDPDYDIACIQLDAPIDGADYFGMWSADDTALVEQSVNIAGYPSDRDSGQILYHHDDNVLSTLPQRIAYAVDTFRGQSGAPVWMTFNNPNPARYVVAVHTAAREPTLEAFGIDGNSGTRISAAIFDWITTLR